MAVAVEELESLVGTRFPGGTYTIERWENILLSDVMASEPLPDDVAHPAYLFHMPLAGVGMTIADMFRLCRAESDEAVRAGEYRWDLYRPLRVGSTYRMSGGIVGAERKQGRRGGLMDFVTFQIDVRDDADGEPVATTTSTWILLRSS